MHAQCEEEEMQNTRPDQEDLKKNVRIFLSKATVTHIYTRASAHVNLSYPHMHACVTHFIIFVNSLSTTSSSFCVGTIRRYQRKGRRGEGCMGGDRVEL